MLRLVGVGAASPVEKASRQQRKQRKIRSKKFRGYCQDQGSQEEQEQQINGPSS
ncbi:hypothetical protein KEM54_003802, partial [Ascosphaera aggregata]